MTVRDRGANSDRSVDVSALLAELSVAQKAGQLVGTYVGDMGWEITLEEAQNLVVEDHVGTVAAFGIGVSKYHAPARVAEVANELQRVAIEETDHGIPLLVPVDAVHGHAYVEGAAVFPHGLGMAATRTPAHARRAGEITAREMHATGATVNYGPTCDVARDPRWGRTFETFGESSLLCGAFAGSVIEGLESREEGPRVAATAKHFPAYGDPEGGEDAAAVDRSTTTFHRLFVPPFAEAIEAGASAVMPCYNAVDGEPAHGSQRLLTELLRERLGFDGPVISDWGGVDMLHEDHRVTGSRRESTRRAVEAGLDQVSIGGGEYAAHVADLVRAGELSEFRLDEAVSRILELKADLGLFEDPYVDVERAVETVGADDHRAAALEAARDAQTLLKNDEDLLPLSPDVDSVLVTGPNADSLTHQVGGWSVTEPTAGITVREAIKAAVGPETTVRYERGATTTEAGDLGAVADAAADSSVAVVVAGENWYFHEFGPQGVAGPTNEFPTRSSLGLPEAQRALIECVVATGTPTVLVTIAGRPLAIERAAGEVPAILQAYYPGSEGGRAVADTLFGEHNPFGRLPISVPRSAGDLPTVFDHLAHPMPIGDDEHPDTYDPLFPFGHGESYTEFVLEELSTPESVGPAANVKAVITVENVGDRAGTRALDFFLTDRVSSRVRPEREHAAFTTVSLEPGESTTASVTVPNEALAVTHSRGRLEVEPGEFGLHCGDESATFSVR